MKQIPKGFTLIELMIVITIIGILSAIAIPTYQHYTLRARFTEVIAATEPFKTAVAIALQQGEAMTGLNNGVHGIPDAPQATRNLASLSVKDGIITAQGSHMTGDATLILTPNGEGSVFVVSGSCVKTGLCEG